MRYFIPLMVLLSIIGMVWYFVPIPNEGQLNYKTGVIRYRYLWIPISSQRLGAFESEWGSLNLPDTWGTVVEYPLKSSNNTDLMIRNFMRGICVWAMYDKDLAKILATDLIDYIDRTRCREGLPKYVMYDSAFVVDTKSKTLKFADEILRAEEEKDPVKAKLNEFLRRQATDH